MSAPAPFTVHAYRPGAEEAFIPLLKRTLGETAVAPQSSRFWSWKHRENPFGQSYGLYAWDESAQRALALRVLMRWRFLDAAGGSADAVRAVDTATAPECRRLGLFTTLTTLAVEELSREGARFIFNTPNAASLPGYLKMGWQVVAVWPLYLQVVGLRGPACGSGRGPAVSLPWSDFFGAGAHTWSGFRERFGAEAGRLLESWERTRPRRGLRTERSISYLDWRYGGHPSLTYAVVPALRRGALCGFAVLRPNIRRGLREAVLAELFLQEADPFLAGELLRAVRKAARVNYLVAHFAAGSFELSALRRAWYLRVPRRGLTFTVRVLRAGGTDPGRAESWDLSAGDLEVF